ncbi:hypothetical protein VA596_24825 [Amycolatopsis sp., V23-08]|uniref:Transposase n=1 Tax=Amycolatopsis heterodermiae TaxID=3110235 RepID=A0ABU5RAW8_9PSEU|nr:hypothetical protein [Amycolatopsis sp., V23-08]MEA5362784.1 hypothetical protein [Amycolatopsis sp., V23-08]
MFRQRLAGHSVASIARHLNERGVPCPSSADPDRIATEPAAPGRSALSPSSWRTRATPDGRSGIAEPPTPKAQHRRRHYPPRRRIRHSSPNRTSFPHSRSERPDQPAKVKLVCSLSQA